MVCRRSLNGSEASCSSWPARVHRSPWEGKVAYVGSFAVVSGVGDWCTGSDWILPRPWDRGSTGNACSVPDDSGQLIMECHCPGWTLQWRDLGSLQELRPTSSSCLLLSSSLRHAILLGSVFFFFSGGTGLNPEVSKLLLN